MHCKYFADLYVLYISQAFTSNGQATMTIPDRDLEYLISNSKSGFSFYDVAEINKAYGCVSGKNPSKLIKLFLIGYNTKMVKPIWLESDTYDRPVFFLQYLTQ